jgi:hypothetical protein
MKLVTRALLLTFIVGLTLLLVALQTPSSSLEQSLPAGSQAPQIFFFQPMMVSISISQLQGNAELLVAPVNYDSSLGSPIVNVSVIAQDVITFSVHNRGYYEISFLYNNGSNPAVSYVVDELGIRLTY